MNNPAEREHLRAKVERVIDLLIAFLDDLDGDPDLEPNLAGDDREGDDADLEPDLGWTEDGAGMLSAGIVDGEVDAYE